MGHTLPTATQLIREYEAELKPLARALRRQDAELLQELLAMTFYQSAPIAYHASPQPISDFLLAMLIGTLKRVKHLEQLMARYPALGETRDAEE